MLKENKGYTLIELLLTMAIFSVIMLGVVAIMRSTAVTFNNGADEIAVQTEAQIVASQIEDLMAASDTSVSYAAGVCKISNTDNDYYIALDSINDQLKYAVKTAGGTLEASDWTLLADYVTSFNVSGLEFGDPAVGDNCAKISISLDKNGYKATAVKDVYFRNTIENKSNQDTFISVTGNNGNPNPSQPNTHNVELARYDTIALGDYGIVTGATLITGTETYYQFVDIDGVPTSTEFEFIGCTDMLNHNFDLYTPSVGTYGVKGYNSSGAEVTVIINTPAVGLDVGNGVYTLMYGSMTADNPRTSFIKTTGLDMFNFNYSGDMSTAVYDIVLYNDANGNDKYDSGESLKTGNNLEINKTGQSLSVYTGQNSGTFIKMDNPSIHFKVSTAQDFSGVVIEQNTNNLPSSNDLSNGSLGNVSAKASAGDLRLMIKLSITGTGTTFTKTGDLAVVVAGMKLDDSKHVGNVY